MGWSMQGFTSLTIPSGATTGARVVIVNPVTGDVMDVYNALNQLIANIDSDGQYTVYQFDTFSHAAIQHTQFGQEGIIYFSDVDNSDAIMEWTSSAAGAPSTQAVWTIQVANNDPGTHFEVYTLQVFAGSDDASKGPTMVGTERQVTGSVVQSDQVSTSNLEHMVAISDTTDASGFLVFNHGASFKDAAGNPKAPNFIFTQAHGAGTPAFGHCNLVDGSITATQAKVLCVNNNGTIRTSAPVTFWAWSKG